MRFIRSSKLSDWCLQVILDNLPFFMYNEAIPQKHIDFLLRVYSKDVYRQYRNQNPMTEESTLWFLSPYNKNVTVCYVTESIVMRLQDIGSGITSLKLHQSFASEMVVNSIICCIPNVKYLDLSSSSCADSTLLCIQRMCPVLETLSVSRCETVTDCGMKYLYGNQSLINLDILETNVSYNGLYIVLRGVPTLQRLEFENLADSLYYIHEYDFRTGDCRNLRYNLIDLEMLCSINPFLVLWTWAILCPNVKRLTFEFPIDNRLLDMCRKFKKLEEIRVNVSANPTGVKYFLTPLLHFSNNIRELDLSSAEVPIIILLENFKNLKTLCLHNVTFSEFNRETLKIQETKLEILMIRNTAIEFPETSYKAIALLISLSKNVTQLYFRFLNIPGELFPVIVNSMKRLTFVDFSFCRLNLNFIHCFFKMPSMRKLYCDLCPGFSLNDDPTLRNYLSESCCTFSWRISNESYFSTDEYNVLSY